ncbi:dihydrolipoyl dehydrogenase [Novipirellula artificiosorum]|uniref:Dihydrolipoyl dehydrogenase n=1 Tax=Novipirellula artificiosorum TaxID=2528016 RepID=A0A5C6DDD5_9BACT|nr:dihydrolipoyl dehydrogenase [Novipirellula artificiosorum]TWU33701.1 Dihydrolipoyl dehydrogenase [Novipirellula artificiosorum]
MHSPLVVLGGGPGGYAAAFLAADEGLEVTIVESETRLGGTCLLRGCIPSKALLHVAKIISDVEELRQDWGVDYGERPNVSIDKVRARKDQVIATLTGGLGQLAKRRNVTIIQARGSFIDSTTLRLEGDHESIPEGGTLTFDQCILATGSVPAIPPAFDIGSDRVMDSTGALSLPDIPEKLLIVGGGYIGLEMLNVYASFGTKVTVVEMADRLLPGADADLVKPLAKRIDKLCEGRVLVGTKVGSLTEVDDRIEVTFEGPKHFGHEQFDRVLVSIGRRPVTRGLGLENTKCIINERGFVVTDTQQRTADPHIFAIGDVAGDPMLAHKATHEGRVAAEVIAGKASAFDKVAIPAVVFTDPEIAWAGLTETDAKKAGVEYQVEAYPWAASGRAQALGITDGLTKWLVDPETHRVIGCGIVGTGAGELIAEAVLAIEMGCEMHDITDSIHPHPTLSETLMNAGEVYFGTATEIFKPRKKPSPSA